MIKMNEKMRMELKAIDWGRRQLLSALSDLATQGVTERAGCFFLLLLLIKERMLSRRIFWIGQGGNVF
ncbi:hypothetical protein [Pseudomonas fluorescens]|uniref:hypothetical protein n=1 Tax=Pseudomonas fluorescens TaxID=294 RepID=UPI000CA15F01|nr:hypothetical protein [Pseudomonas fluorescens]AUM68833.1 hypothetical protein C0J56_07900 [Pseudomonas fluorescens]